MFTKYIGILGYGYKSQGVEIVKVIIIFRLEIDSSIVADNILTGSRKEIEIKHKQLKDRGFNVVSGVFAVGKNETDESLIESFSTLLHNQMNEGNK